MSCHPYVEANEVWLCRGSTVPNQPAGVFWAVVSSLLIIFQIIILFRKLSHFSSEVLLKSTLGFLPSLRNQLASRIF